jgi:hypothetical protein
VRARAGLLVAVAAAAVLVGWWAWPSITGADDELDVLVVRDDLFDAAERSIALRVREEGKSVAWTGSGAGWCDDPVPAAELRGAERVVVSLDGDAACLDAFVGAFGGDVPGSVLAVVRPGGALDADALAAAGLDVIDPAPLLGVPTPGATAPCEWWEECPPEGAVVVWDASGLTAAGGERLARSIVAGL